MTLPLSEKPEKTEKSETITVSEIAENQNPNSFDFGMIVKSSGGLYSVRNKSGRITECRAKGSFRKEHMTPLAGDKVRFELQPDNTGFIVEIEPRKNALIRPAAANIDLLVIVAAVTRPEPDLYVLDKLTAVAAHNKIKTMLVINKCDLKSPTELCEIYRTAGIETVPMCTKNTKEYANQLEFIKKRLCGRLTFFAGASGVGKSSLINALFPELCLSTGTLSRKIQRGKHTTRCTELFCVDNDTFIADTPGFSMLDIAGYGMFASENLMDAFPDIRKFALNCRYKKCTHICEEGCGVMEAVRDGSISTSRHESFKKLYAELKEIKPWET